MNIILLGSTDFSFSRNFLQTLAKYRCTVRYCTSLEDFHQFLLEERSVECVIGHDRDLHLIKELIKRYPSLHYTVASSLDSKDFHERTEGYGIFMQLPEIPGGDDARKLMAGIARWSNVVITDKEEAQ